MFSRGGGSLVQILRYIKKIILTRFIAKFNAFLHFYRKIQCVSFYEAKSKVFLNYTNQALPTSCIVPIIHVLLFYQSQTSLNCKLKANSIQRNYNLFIIIINFRFDRQSKSAILWILDLFVVTFAMSTDTDMYGYYGYYA